MKSKDWIGLIETIYRLEGREEAWLNRILDHAVPLFGRGFGPAAGAWSYTPTTVKLDSVVTCAPNFVHSFLEKTLAADPKMVDSLYRGGAQMFSLSEIISLQSRNRQSLGLLSMAGRMGDLVGLRTATGTGRGTGIILGFLKASITPEPLERQRWSRIASHMGAGLRLRGLFERLTLEASQVEAIFEADGTLQDARDKATERTARTALREMVKRLDLIRTRPGRRNSDSAMQLWEGLVQGRWSLVDYFDSDRRRFVLAIKNDPTYPDPRGLTMQERQVAEFMGLGQSCKEISYSLGVSPSAVTNCTGRIQQKLGLSSLAEVAAFFAPSGLRTKLAEISVQGEELLVGAYPLMDENHVQGLTDTEQAVLAHMMSGSTNSDIAQRRQTSENTVANQVQSIYRKLQVSSRSELAARLQSVA